MLREIKAGPSLDGQDKLPVPMPGEWTGEHMDAFAERLDQASLEARKTFSRAVLRSIGRQRYSYPSYGAFGETTSGIDVTEYHSRLAIIYENNQAYDTTHS